MKLPLMLCLVSLGVAAFATGCGPSYEEDEFEFGAAEMRSAIVGDWSGELAMAGKRPTAITVHLEHQPPGVAPACGNRALGVGLQCAPVSSLGLKGTFSSADGVYLDTPVVGSFNVDTVVMTWGRFSLQLADDTELSASWNQGSPQLDEGVVEVDYQPVGSFTLRR